MTVSEAAIELELSEERIRKLCQGGRLGEKVAGVWLITREQLNEFKNNRRGPGRPRKGEDITP